jgi:hypothetical protein
MRITVTSNAKAVERAILGIVAKTVNDPIANLPRYESLMKRGTASHFARLGWGGSDPSALGGGVTWPTARHPITMRHRRGRGFPLLDMGNGRLRRGFTDLAGSRIETLGREGVRIRHTSRDPAMLRLGAVHQKGLAPLEGRRQGFPDGFRVPKRQFVYWDAQMAAEAAREVRRAFRVAKAGVR